MLWLQMLDLVRQVSITQTLELKVMKKACQNFINANQRLPLGGEVIERASFGSVTQASTNPMSSVLLADDEKMHSQIDDMITRLIRLSRQIREHQKIKRDAIAADYEPHDEHGTSASTFAKYLDWKLDGSKQKMRASFMKDRMRDTLMARWRKLSYYAAQQPQLSRHEPAIAANDVSNQLPRELRVSKHVFPDVELPTPAAAKESIGEVFRAPMGPQSHGLTLSTAFKPHHETTSIAPSRNTKSLVGAQVSDFPNPPKLLLGLHEFRCPFCGILQPRSMVEPTSWR